MKKITLICSLCVSAYMTAQTFSDNFDSYIAGQKLAQQSAGAWTTWSNAPGGTEDGLVSNANSVSPSNSMYFSSNLQTGGPVDQVKVFGVQNTGSFSLEWNMFVETGKAAYFNLQKTATIGQVYALNANFNDDGTMAFDDGVTTNFSSTFLQNVWFNFRLDINFNTNTWEVFIDDVSKGIFSSAVNQIASIDIFPVDQNTPYASGFYVDDFQYTVNPYVLPTINAAANLVSFTGSNLVGSSVSREVKVRNLGTTAITSFDITCNYNGSDIVQNVTGINLASLAETTITITSPMILIAGSNDLTATISNVNGTVDGDANDNVATLNVNPIIPALGKMVVGEEGTGTWCGWCPRGAVFMDMMDNTYAEYWAGIAVHNGDPMTNTVYDTGIGALIAGYPTSLVDRGPEDDPSAMEEKFLTNIQILPDAVMKNEATWNSTTRVLTVTVKAKFIQATTGNYKLACVISEDDVTGTVAGYKQTNYYAGGANGVMGGYESLPSSVPAAQMVYNHVAREILPSFAGESGVIPSVVAIGEEFMSTYTFTLPATYDETKIHVISMLIEPSGVINNAGKSTFDAAQLASTSEITLDCGSMVNIMTNSGITTIPDFTTSLVNSTTCAGTTTVAQTPLAGSPLQVGANNVIILSTDACGNKQVCFKTVNYSDNASLTENDIENLISLFPNPTTNLLNFSAKSNSVKNIRILTIDGKEVFKQNSNLKSGVISVSNLNNGLYNVEFTLENGTISSQRFIKE